MMTALENLVWLRPWWLLAGLPALLVLGWRWRQLRSDSNWQQVVDPQLLVHVIGVRQGSSWVSSRMSLILLASVWLLSVLALAGPSWQSEPRPVHRIEGARVLVLDLSVSMLAADVSPDRITRARFKLRELLRQSPEGETALIVFAGEAHIVMPLTDDPRNIEAQVAALAPALMPVPGSDAATALAMAGELLANGAAGASHVVLLTDGIDDADAAQAAARTLRKQGHRLTVWGIGTAQGAPIPTGTGFVRDAAGAIRVARLDPAPLRALARVGGGQLVPASADDADLHTVLAQTDPSRQADLGAAAEAGGQTANSQPLDGGIWLLPAVLLLFSLRFRRGWLPMLLVALLAPGLPRPAQALDVFTRADQRAAAALRRGDQAAAEQFEDPQWQAAAHYRNGDFEAAALGFEAAGDSADAWYNRANALARMQQYRQAVAAYDEALSRAPDMEDALFNKALVSRLLPPQASPNPAQQSEGQSSGSDAQLNEGDTGEAGASASGAGTAEQGNGAQGEAGGAPQAEPQSAENEQQSTPGEETNESVGEAGPAQANSAPDVPPDQASAAGQAGGADGQQQIKQRLQLLPDDPGGLLREKFRRQALRRRASGAGGG